MKTLARMIPTLLLALLCAGPALAQDGLLEGDPLLEGQLEERKAPQKKMLDDPDAGLLEEVNTKRGEMEKTINGLAEASTRFAKIEKGSGKLTAQMLKAHDAYLEKHNKALQAYRDAKSAGDEAKQKKAAKAVVELRKKYLKAINKIQKGADKLATVAAKLQAKIDSGKAKLEDPNAEGAEGADAADE